MHLRRHTTWRPPPRFHPRRRPPWRRTRRTPGPSRASGQPELHHQLQPLPLASATSSSATSTSSPMAAPEATPPAPGFPSHTAEVTVTAPNRPKAKALPAHQRLRRVRPWLQGQGATASPKLCLEMGAPCPELTRPKTSANKRVAHAHPGNGGPAQGRARPTRPPRQWRCSTRPLGATSSTSPFIARSRPGASPPVQAVLYFFLSRALARLIAALRPRLSRR